MSPFDLKKKPILITPDAETKGRKPSSALKSQIPEVGMPFSELAAYASDAGMSGGALSGLGLRVLREFIRGGVHSSRLREALQRDVCPICFDFGCPWPESEEARLMGWGGRRVKR